MEATAVYNTEVDEATRAGYKPIGDQFVHGNHASAIYILAKDGRLLYTNYPIKKLPAYEVELPDVNDPNKTIKTVHYEASTILDLIKTGTVNPNSAGIRIYNVKYMLATHGENKYKTFYLKSNGGGALIAECDNVIIVATFDGNAYNTSQKGGDKPTPQTMGNFNKWVEDTIARCSLVA